MSEAENPIDHSLNVKFSVFLLIIYVLIFFFEPSLCVAQSSERHKVAVVLSGGGAKGFAHIGVLKVLEEECIPIDMIVGTSMGSIVGGLYSIGYTTDDLIELARTEKWSELFSDYIPRKQLDSYSRIEQQRYILTLPVARGTKPAVPSGLIKGQNIINLFCGLAANVPSDADFSRFPVSFACIGTDLENGKEVIMTSGFLPTAIYSSMAIPGVFVPGEHNGYTLVDGGLVNNFPTDVARKLGADIIIGVDITDDLYKAGEIVSMNRLMGQLITFYTLQKDSLNKRLCNVIIRPDIKGYNTYSFSAAAADSLILRGERAARELAPRLRELRSTFKLIPQARSSDLVTLKEWKINDIEVPEDYRAKERFIKNNFELDLPGTYTYEDIKKSINYLFSSKNFSRLYFYLEEDTAQGKILKMSLKEDKPWNINVGMRINTYRSVSILLNSTRKDYSKPIDVVSLTADLSSCPRVTFLAETGIRNLPRLAFLIDGSYNRFTAHLGRDDAYAENIYMAMAKLYSYQRISSHGMIGTGIRQDLYSGILYGFRNEGDMPLSDKDKPLTHFYAYVDYDNLDNYYYPAGGTDAYSEFSIVKDFDFSNVSPVAMMKVRNYIRVNPSLTVLLNFYGRTILSNDYPQYIENFLVAKDYEVCFDHHLPFYGLPSLWSVEKNLFIGLLGLRVRVAKNQYIKAESNILFDNRELLSLDNYRSLWGTALTYAYNSPVGPFEFSLGYSNGHEKLVFTANAGFWF